MIRGLFVCEGTSDIPLGSLVEDLLADEGLETRIVRPDLSTVPDVSVRRLDGKIRAATILHDGPPDVLVVHRDVDRTSDTDRRTEIDRSVGVVGLTCPVICVFPQTMTESWLLVDVDEIRFVSGNPDGRVGIELPPHVESVSDSKAVLQVALVDASGLRGRRAARFKARLPQARRELLERLDRHGPVRQLDSFQRLVVDVQRAAERLREG